MNFRNKNNTKMRFLRAISRFLTGAVFILSGFLKIIDPVGFGLKISEYLTAFHLGWLAPLSVCMGIVLSAAEFIIGVCVLKGIKMRFFTLLALVFISFFTLLTFVSALWNPVSDCGCFGEAVHLTNWETFFKDVVLLACAVLIYVQRNKFKPIADSFWEIVYLCVYGALIVGIAVYSLMNLPLIDFGAYKAGTDLEASVGVGAEREYETTFIYSKDGREQEFDIDNIPDSTWQFVDARTVLVKAAGREDGLIDFALKNRDGEYVTEEILNSPDPVFFISLYKKETPRIAERASRLRDLLKRIAPSASVYLINGNSMEETDPSEGQPEEAVPVLYTDYKTALTLNRSNGGLTYLSKGMIVDKWACGNYPFRKLEKLLAADPDIVTARVVIREQLSAEFFLLLVFFMILIVRFFSKRIYIRSLVRRRLRSDLPEKENPENI